MFGIIIMSLSIWSMFGMEPVQPDDISVYDKPAGYESSYESNGVTVDIQQPQYVDKGHVGGDDELHIVGYPTDSEGYSVNPSYIGEQKGFVFPEDELHIIGLPTDERGYTKAGSYGIIK